MGFSRRLATGISSRIQHSPNMPHVKDLIKNWNIIKGDEVMIITGKEQGKTGTVQQVIRNRNKILVTGKNLAWKHVSPTEEHPGGKLQKEMPIHVSNVQLLDPNTKKPCKIELRRVLDEATGKSKRQRFVAGTNTMIPRPKFIEYIAERRDGPYDTMPDNVAEVTYTPDIAEDPIPVGVINELRSPYRAIYDKFNEIRKLERKKEDLEKRLSKKHPNKYPGFVPGGTIPREVPSAENQQ